MAARPETIHDFHGFPDELYRIRYPATGCPEVAREVGAALEAAGLEVQYDTGRGLDHGAWVPLSAMYPDAEVPVVQFSLMRGGGPAAHLALGRALAPLREEGVLILASGAITHNFGWLDWQGESVPQPPACAFADWVGGRLAENDEAALLDYRSSRYGAEAHPTDEHFLPLFVALGAAAGGSPARHQPRYAYGSLSMDAYVWQ
jgi:4,5-DOPA dioxygenase extradiol